MPSTVSGSPSASPSFLRSGRKRFQTNDLPSPPLLTLDREGTICSITRAARQLLEYRPDDRIDDCFFSHVHKHNLHRVMHDLADMVSRGRRRAQWLLRLRTGRQRWRWYRSFVQNRLGHEEERILVRLRSQ